MPETIEIVLFDTRLCEIMPGVVCGAMVTCPNCGWESLAMPATRYQLEAAAKRLKRSCGCWRSADKIGLSGRSEAVERLKRKGWW